MANIVIRFELNDRQQEKFDEWCSHIKALYGNIGLFTWSYQGNGIGESITVYSDIAKVGLDLTDSSEW